MNNIPIEDQPQTFSLFISIKQYCRLEYTMKSLSLIILAVSTLLWASAGIGAAEYDLTGTWAMVANTDFNFKLDMQQQNSVKFSGMMIRTNGQEPVDIISGTISPDGTVKFTRERPNEWTQKYSGVVSGSSGDLLMKGTFIQTGVAGQYPWIACKNARTEAESAFQNNDQKMNQLWQMMSEIVKNMNEMQAGMARNLI